jgi:hypothetical protein
MKKIGMKKEIRIQKIKEIIDLNKSNPFGKQEIPWEDDLKTMNVYKIPLNLLVYNKYNGRILSRTKSLEKQSYIIDETSSEGKTKIEELLWKSKIDRNKKTQKNIADFGQQKVGIITKDGIIIDGNRRAMLLNDIKNDGVLSGKTYNKKYDYFKAVILPVTLQENPLEIKKLETSFQMGEDKKLGYNPTEKYLKAQDHYLEISGLNEIDTDEFDDNAIAKIANWMGEEKSEIKKYLYTMKIMDEYLYSFGYDGIYTQLDSREDQFLSLTKWLDSFYDKESRKGFDGYNNTDVHDLKDIAFDYLRIRNEYDGKEFRNLAEGSQENHFFGNKELWKKFSNRHFEIRKKIENEPEIDFNSMDLKRHLDERDKLYYNNSKLGGEKSALLENLRDTKQTVHYNKEAEAPEKLVKRASQAFSAIKRGHGAFSKPEVQKLVKDLADQVTDSLQRKSPINLLQHILQLVDSIELEKVPEHEKEDVQKKAKEISKILYHIYK